MLWFPLHGLFLLAIMSNPALVVCYKMASQFLYLWWWDLPAVGWGGLTWGAVLYIGDSSRFYYQTALY
jgi:hypothetical protein